jgi:DNA-binding HxlR family transcriptional regulator
VLETIPPKVEYSLTEFGAEVAQRLHGLIELVESRLHEVMEAALTTRGRILRPNRPG